MSIYLSYARADYGIAKELAGFLSARGYEVWWDAGPVGNDDTHEVVQRQVAAAAAVIVIWSPSAAASPLVRQAAEEGLHGRKLIATRIRGLDIRQVPVGLRAQPTDYVDERDKIVSAVARMDSLPVRRPPASASPPAPVPAGAPAPQEMAPAQEAQSAWACPVSMRIGEVLTGLALVACSVFFGWQSALLPFGTVGLPGPGFFPFALAVVLGALALLIVLYTLRNADRRQRLFIGHRDVLVAIAALIGVAVAFERGDSYLVLGAFTLVMLVTVGRTKWWRAVIGAGLGMVAVWAVFNLALGVRLPVGEVWDQVASFIGAALASVPF